MLILILGSTLLQAQKAAGGSPGNSVSTSGGNRVRTGPSKGFFPRHSGVRRYHRNGTVWLPWEAPYWDDDGYRREESFDRQLTNTDPPQVIVVDDEGKEPRQPAPPPVPPKLIEVPQSKDAELAQQRPPTLFVLKGGERFESRYYLLTLQSLKIEVDRQRRTIPVSSLDLETTIAANRERGIEVFIPQDRGTVFLGF